MDYSLLKSKQREVRDGFSENLALRVHRALSWLNKSEQCNDDQDSQFIFLWIAFNAAYAQDTEVLRHTESEAFSKFISKLIELDNKYVYQPFWDYHNGKITECEWKERFSKAKSAASHALSNKSTDVVICIVLQRLYTLRNQIIHGGATWNSSANREQIRDGVAFLSELLPIIVNVMMDSPDTLWGDANYPLISE